MGQENCVSNCVRIQYSKGTGELEFDRTGVCNCEISHIHNSTFGVPKVEKFEIRRDKRRDRRNLVP